MPEQIPDAVIDALEDVRADGEIIIIAYNSVVRDMLSRADSGRYPAGMKEAEYRSAVAWLVNNKDRYVEAQGLMSLSKRPT